MRDKEYSDALGVEEGGHLRPGSILDRQEHLPSSVTQASTPGASGRTQQQGGIPAKEPGESIADVQAQALGYDLRFSDERGPSPDAGARLPGPLASSPVPPSRPQQRYKPFTDVTEADMDAAAYSLLNTDG